MNTGAKERPISQILAAEAYERNKEKKKVRDILASMQKSKLRN